MAEAMEETPAEEKDKEDREEALAKRGRHNTTDAQEEGPKKPRSRPLMLHVDALPMGPYRTFCEMGIAEVAKEG